MDSLETSIFAESFLQGNSNRSLLFVLFEHTILRIRLSEKSSLSAHSCASICLSCLGLSIAQVFQIFLDLVLFLTLILLFNV